MIATELLCVEFHSLFMGNEKKLVDFEEKIGGGTACQTSLSV